MGSRVGFVLVCVLVCFSGTSLIAQTGGAQVPAGPRPLAVTSFGFQCVYDTQCGDSWDGGTWITTKSQPGLVRLWTSGVEWAILETGAGTYDWTDLDVWLDLVAANQPRSVMYTFGHVPCFIAIGCHYNAKPAPWTAVPPSDLTSQGSPTFDTFVNALVNHCSPAGNCVKDYIKYWELWNEANCPGFWAGSIDQLYSMMRPAVDIIRRHIPQAVIMNPPPSGSDAGWVGQWLTEENTRGRLSDVLRFPPLHDGLGAGVPNAADRKDDYRQEQ